MKFLLLIVSVLMLTACASQPQSVLVLESVDDIPLIDREYAEPLSRLQKGMTKSQVVTLFPNIERECYESGVCHFTVFDQRLVQIDRRLADLDLLTGSLMSALALTCVLAEDSCEEAIVAALNVGIASMVGSDRIKHGRSSTSSEVTAAVLLGQHQIVGTAHAINHAVLGTTEGVTQNRNPNRSEITGTFTLIQWINIEFEQGVVTEWAINEPLNQFKPKTFKNELPSLEDALGLDN